MGARFAPYLRRQLRRARLLIHSPLRDLHVILVNDKQMSQLHRDFLGLDSPTDVLTFPIDLDPRGRPLSGEVYVCVPYARRQAKERNIHLPDELLLYALHGVLHLSGYDDRTHADYLKMHKMEDKVLRDIGVGNVFAGRKARRGAGGPGGGP